MSGLKTKRKSVLGQKVNIIPKRYEAIGDYFKIKNQPRLKKIDEKNQARETAVTDLITAQRLLTEKTQELNDVRDSMQSWHAESQLHWQKLKEREIELREAFLRFNDFVRENYDKRKRAEIKIGKEVAIQERQQEQMSIMRDGLIKMQEIDKELSEKIAKFQIYKNFLQKVVDESDEYHEVQDIISRYEILSLTESKLNAQQANTQAVIQVARENLMKASGNQAQTMMKLQTELSTLRLQQETIRAETMKWEANLATSRAYAAKKAIEMQQVQNTCWDLYKTMCRLRKESITLPENATEQQLDHITQVILDLAKIIRIAKEKAETHKPHSNAILATSTLPYK